MMLHTHSPNQTDTGTGRARYTHNFNVNYYSFLCCVSYNSSLLFVAGVFLLVYLPIYSNSSKFHASFCLSSCCHCCCRSCCYFHSISTIFFLFDFKYKHLNQTTNLKKNTHNKFSHKNARTHKL